ncbi:DUF5063 domain-containing protein [Nocardioides sp. zg-536]|uniref:DUF5063 domain-containing protein n=1 Tax=Nocardioides faecalis TaxID=2803858 RepID=A0A938Y860_9ACTN|nr:DUF5063 domain-containing protein [Nocardioides faecalis]MBM9460994.1 DUF5063 domain-containing protein [Nocardioides faecalis]MBS4752100.1 DUF5063 domain-containing protein [Nocardioides faecalis]QVI59090.1 DUF5063 domain-containing protein [Nocardioides faecalis]
MSDIPGAAPVLDPRSARAPSAETIAFAEDIATSVRGFLDALPTIATQATPGQAVSLLLLEIGQIALAGARLGVQRDFDPREEYQPDVGPDADVEELRMRIAELLGDADTYSYVFDPYRPELVTGLLSDDLASIAADLELGLRHHGRGDVDEALWWWQFSYVSSWGAQAGAAMKALLSVVAHDRLDVEVPSEEDQVAAVSTTLDSGEEQ